MFNYRVDELVLMGEYVKMCYSRDHMEFIKYSPEFWEPHLSKFNSKFKEVSNVVRRNQTSRQLNEIDSRVALISPIITEYLNQLQTIFNFVNLKILVRKTSPVFQNLHHYVKEADSEKLVFYFNHLKQAVLPYLKQLEEAGFDHGLQAELDAYISILNAEYVEKKSLMVELEQWELKNAQLFNEFWTMLDHILIAGQKIFYSNPIKYNEYQPVYILEKAKEEVAKRNA